MPKPQPKAVQLDLIDRHAGGCTPAPTQPDLPRGHYQLTHVKCGWPCGTVESLAHALRDKASGYRYEPTKEGTVYPHITSARIECPKCHSDIESGGGVSARRVDAPAHPGA